jgi:parvulin-like peptidyl-prolyl isomerase
MATKKTAKKTTTKTTTKATARKAPVRTSSKTAPAKTVATKTTVVKSTAAVSTPKTETEKSTKTQTPQQVVTLRRKYLILIIVIVLLGAALFYFRGLFVAAVVNGQPISRLAVIQQAEKQSGKTTLDTLVRDALIEQEAKKEGVTVSDQEVTAQISTLQSNLQKQGQSLNDVLSQQGMTMDDLRNLIRLDQLVQKMVGKNIKITDKEINDYINQNKSSLPPGLSGNALKSQVKAQLVQEKTNEAVQTWLANLQKKANIVYFVQY